MYVSLQTDDRPGKSLMPPHHDHDIDRGIKILQQSTVYILTHLSHNHIEIFILQMKFDSVSLLM